MGITLTKFEPGDYVIVMKNGITVKEGFGLAVRYNKKKTNILLVPTTAYDNSFAFEDLVTADFQTVCVQGCITFRIADCKQAVKMADFSYDSTNPAKQQIALTLFGKRIANIAKTALIKQIGTRDIRSVVRMADKMADLIEAPLKEETAIANLGVEILSINILGILAKPETRKALEAAAREQILKEQDDAVYKRRNAAIEQERIIRENELNTEIKTAEKEKEKKEKEQEIKRRLLQTELQMEKEKLEEKIRLEERNKDLVEAETENERVRTEQKTQAIAALVDVLAKLDVKMIEACAMANMDPAKLLAKGFLEMSENADKIGTLNLTPDLLTMIAGTTKKAG